MIDRTGVIRLSVRTVVERVKFSILVFKLHFRLYPISPIRIDFDLFADVSDRIERAMEG